MALNISSQNASMQLFQCLHDKLNNLANDPKLMARSEEHLAKLIKSVKITIWVKRAELISLHLVISQQSMSDYKYGIKYE